MNEQNSTHFGFREVPISGQQCHFRVFSFRVRHDISCYVGAFIPRHRPPWPAFPATSSLASHSRSSNVATTGRKIVSDPVFVFSTKGMRIIDKVGIDTVLATIRKRGDKL